MNRNRFLALAAAVLTFSLTVDPLGAATLHFAGSSQLDDGGRKVGHYPYWSWGTELEKYMAPGHRVRNCARSGASTKSFREFGEWRKLIDGVKPGDFVGIQFGANDQKCNTDFYREKRWAAPDGLFTDIEREWVNEVRAKGATPILISHSGRCTFDKDGKRIVDRESVVAENATDVFLVGEGTVRLAKGGSVTIRNCQGVRLKGFTLRGTDAVPLRILGSTDVSERGVTVTAAAGTDALTLEGSRDVTVEKCRFSRFSAAELRKQAQYALIRDNGPVRFDFGN